MHIIVKCEDMIIARVLIDNGSALNVCPVTTLERLKVDLSLIQPSTMIIRAFDGTSREVKGEIELMIEIGPRSFMVNLEVIKVESPYNMLLGRPCLHAVGVVVFTLHRRLKFISENQLITIMAEELVTLFHEICIPYIDANAFPKASFHRFELVSMIHNASELESGWPALVLMVVKEMLKFGYKLGIGLKPTGHGSRILVELSDNKGGFSLGYTLTHG